MRVTDRDRGSATVWLLGLSLLLWTLTGAALLVGEAVVVRHRVEAAADLAALAAAERALAGARPACAAAVQVASEAGAALVRCAVVGRLSEVTAERRPAGLLGLAGPVRARARAGPGTDRPNRPP
ncbi:MAG: hypothetical protein NVSMB13_13320 [Mycobacteriales bacterium]